MDRPTRFPWAQYQQFCLGGLGWSPTDFWKATTWEVIRAYDGYALVNGITKQANKHLAPSLEEFEELKRNLDGNAR